MSEDKQGWQKRAADWAGKALGQGAKAAQTAKEGALSGAQAIKENVAAGAKSFRQNVEEDLARQKETKRIREEGERALRAAEALQFAAKRALEREEAAFQAEAKAVQEGVLHDYVRFSVYLRQSQAGRSTATATDADPAAVPALQMNLWQDASLSAVSAAAAGLAAGAATVGLVTAVGTASTGTAIATLSGPAYVGATLAALGGGSLATGGLGMAGGVAVLGATVAAPAVAVMGYLMDRKIKNNYEKALAWNQEVLAFRASVAALAQKSDLFCASLRSKSKFLYAFAGFFRDLLNMGPGVAALGRTADYAPILNDAATTLIACMELPIARDGQPDGDFEQNLAALTEVAARCRREFYLFLFTLDSTQQRFLVKVQEEDLGRHTDDLPAWVEILRQNLAQMRQAMQDMRQEMHERFDQVDEELAEVRASLCVLAGDVRRLQEETTAGLNALQGDSLATEERLAAFSEELTRRLLDARALRQQKICEREAARLAASFGPNWQRLLPASRRFLVTARVLYAEMAEIAPQMDYSGVCILAAKAIESELKERLFTRYTAYLENRFPFTENPEAWPPALVRRNRRGEMRQLTASQFTLGNVPFLCGTRQDREEQTAENQRAQALLLDYARDSLLKKGTTDEEAQQILWRIGRDADTIAQKYRNPAAHVGALQETDAKACFDFLIDVERAFLWMMEQFA